MPVATDSGACGGKILVKTETSPTSPMSASSRKRPLSSGAGGTVTNGVTWQSSLNDSRLHIGGLGRPRSRFSSVRIIINKSLYCFIKSTKSNAKGTRFAATFLMSGF